MQLVETDPRAMLDRQARQLEEAKAAAAVDRQAREVAEATLASERRALQEARAKLARHKSEVDERSLEFGEKEYYQVTVSHLQELQEAKDGEIAELMKQHAAADKERDEEVSLHGMCMCMR